MTPPHISDVLFQNYEVGQGCYWWSLEDNVWYEGPKMMEPRQRAATLQRDGLIWMLGGRVGSKILDDNEVMLYPGVWNATNHKIWSWMNKVITSSFSNTFVTLSVPEHVEAESLVV